MFRALGSEVKSLGCGGGRGSRKLSASPNPEVLDLSISVVAALETSSGSIF